MNKNKLMSHKAFFYLCAIVLALLGIVRGIIETTPERSYAILGLSLAGAVFLFLIGKFGWFKDKNAK